MSDYDDDDYTPVGFDKDADSIIIAFTLWALILGGIAAYGWSHFR